MAIISPTVTALNVQAFNQQMERLESFVRRVHLDFMDGVFTPTKSPPVEQAWWPIGVVADLHVMYLKPLDFIETIISLSPSLVIVHAEAEGIREFMTEMAGLGIKRGIALLKDSQPQEFAELIAEADHALIFSGDLGRFGGTVDVELLKKVTDLRAINKDIEIGWDGGINADNIVALASGGVDVLNVGGYIQRSDDPQAAYETLSGLLG